MSAQQHAPADTWTSSWHGMTTIDRSRHEKLYLRRILNISRLVCRHSHLEDLGGGGAVSGIQRARTASGAQPASRIWLHDAAAGLIPGGPPCRQPPPAGALSLCYRGFPSALRAAVLLSGRQRKAHGIEVAHDGSLKVFAASDCCATFASASSEHMCREERNNTLYIYVTEAVQRTAC